MAQTVRPLSPHLSVYRWQVQMVTSILHRATGIALSVGFLVVVWGLLALANSEAAWHTFTACAGSVIGIILLIGWTWSFFYHLCNGIRHLLQDGGMGYRIDQFVRSSWLSIIFSLILTIAAWVYVWQGVAA
ncbi:MAG TPA: succinate dehydrogenase, cytochrome b556 subunit [Rhodanobacteraceae bacterium]|nr:succinate dehydrogenase, cytochrome b556 subunit [Rhodanobacteraceae bacterium]